MIFGWLTPVFTLLAFVLLLLSTLSTPIIKGIYLYGIPDRNVRLGLWGYCTSAASGSVGSCSAKHFGYTLDQNLANALGIKSTDSNVITKAITALFVLHPISCALAFLALLFGLLMARPQRAGHTTRISSFLAMLASLIAAILTTATFALDITIGATIIVRLHNTVGHDVIVRTGNAVYMTLGAMIALWLAVITATCGIFQSRRMRNAEKQPAAAY